MITRPTFHSTQTDKANLRHPTSTINSHHQTHQLPHQSAKWHLDSGSQLLSRLSLPSHLKSRTLFQVLGLPSLQQHPTQHHQPSTQSKQAQSKARRASSSVTLLLLPLLLDTRPSTLSAAQCSSLQASTLDPMLPRGVLRTLRWAGLPPSSATTATKRCEASNADLVSTKRWNTSC